MVLVSRSCCNTVAPTGSLKTAGSYCLTALEAGSLKSRSGRTVSLAGRMLRAPSGGPRLFLVWSHCTPNSASIFFFFFFFFFFFAHPVVYRVPRPGSRSEPQLWQCQMLSNWGLTLRPSAPETPLIPLHHCGNSSTCVFTWLSSRCVCLCPDFPLLHQSHWTRAHPNPV